MWTAVWLAPPTGLRAAPALLRRAPWPGGLAPEAQRALTMLCDRCPAFRAPRWYVPDGSIGARFGRRPAVSELGRVEAVHLRRKRAPHAGLGQSCHYHLGYRRADGRSDREKCSSHEDAGAGTRAGGRLMRSARPVPGGRRPERSDTRSSRWASARAALSWALRSWISRPGRAARWEQKSSPSTLRRRRR